MANRALLEGGIHLVDLLISIFGSTPTAVSARHSPGLDEEHDADAVQLVTLEFGAQLGQITMNRISRAGTRYLEVRADCEQASLRASFGGRAPFRQAMKRAEKRGIRLEYGLQRPRLGRAGRIADQARTKPARRRDPRHDAGCSRASCARSRQAASRRRAAARRGQVLAAIEGAYESARTGSASSSQRWLDLADSGGDDARGRTDLA